MQGRGALKRELTACLRTGRALREPRARTARSGRTFVTDEVKISARPAEAADRAVPGHWEGDLIMGLEKSAIGTLVERSSRYTMLLHLPPNGRPRPPTARVKERAAAGWTRRRSRQRRDYRPKSAVSLCSCVISLTWDQGGEMAQHAQLKIDAGIAVYFCRPSLTMAAAQQ